MALRGTLEEFGLANVFQIIGQTSKTGTLTVRDRDDEVKLHFDAAGIVRCDASRRRSSDLLGTMLCRAEAITEAQLADALAVQKKTHKRLGDCLIAAEIITLADLQEFARLQTSETVFRVFLWRSGTYDFTTTTPPVPNHLPLKAESLLMEGFRQIDEWPAIRKRLVSYATTFAVLQNLDELLTTAAAHSAKVTQRPNAASAASSEDSFDDFNLGADDDSQGAESSPLKAIEHKERLIYSLIQPARDVQKLIDLSRLGEFETCRALLHLLDANIIKVNAGQTPAASAEATVGGISGAPRLGHRLTYVLSAPSLLGVRTVLGAWAAFVLILMSGLPPWAAVAQRPAQFLDRSLERALGQGELARLHSALAVYRALHGTYPEALEDLVQAGLVPSTALGLVWREHYAYTRLDEYYTLLAPLY